MQKSFEHFVKHLSYCQGSYTIGHFLKFLEVEHCEELKSLGLLAGKGELGEITCPSCEDHFTPVRIAGEQFYTVCPYEDHERNVLDQADVQKWVFDFQGLLRQLSSKLGISDQVESLLVDGLWQVGGFSKDDTYHTCYFFCGKDFIKAMEFIKTQPEAFRRYVIITCKQEETNIELPHEVLFIEAHHLISFQGGNLKFNKKVFEKHLVNGFRSVIFNEKNGDLLVNGELVVSLTPSSPEFHFAQALWGDFNLPRSHGSLVQHIYKHTRQEYADPDGKTCHKMKRAIKSGAKNKEAIDQIIQSTKTEDGKNGYIMRNPN